VVVHTLELILDGFNGRLQALAARTTRQEQQRNVTRQNVAHSQTGSVR